MVREEFHSLFRGLGIFDRGWFKRNPIKNKFRVLFPTQVTDFQQPLRIHGYPSNVGQY